MAAKVKRLIAFHLFCWLLFLLMPVIFVAGRDPSTADDLITSASFWFFFASFLIVFYFHYYIVIPHLLFKKRYILYGLLIIVGLFLIHEARPFDHMMTYMRSQSPGSPGVRMTVPIDIMSIFLYVMFIAIGLAVRLAQRWRIEIEQVAMAEARRSNAELSLLKARINPHFLFNTLNNIYSLAVLKSEHTPDAIIRLSNIMRYVTDEASREYVYLASELDYIRDYIDLLRLRSNKKVHIEFSVEGDPSNREIAPMMLMPFIENAFKHGISAHNESYIEIRITIVEKEIQLYVRNTVHPTHATGRTGTGIYNTRKRLEHIYKEHYTLSMQQRDNEFILQLNLQDE